MSLPTITDRETWLRARADLLAREKELTRLNDDLSRQRRELPMVEVSEDYRFTGPDGEVGLLDLFGEHRQLVVSHIMFDPAWTDACSSCSAGVREWSPGVNEHLARRETAHVFISRAPYPTLAAHAQRQGWTIPWYSSYGSSFNADLGVTVEVRDGRYEYNYRSEAAWNGAVEGETSEMPGTSCFLRVASEGGADRVFHTYSSYARGAEAIGGSYAYLDLTALGRGEDWEEPKGRNEAARAAVPDFS